MLVSMPMTFSWAGVGSKFTSKVLQTSVAAALVMLFGAACGGSQKSAKQDVPEAPHMNARRFAALLERAAGKFDCPQSHLTHAYAQGLHHVSGCQQQADFVMYCSGWTCVWLDSPAKDGEFAMNCPLDQLQVTRIDETKYGVAGCNQRIAYVVRCHGLQCGWVSDTLSVESGRTLQGNAAPDSSAP